MAKTTKPKPKAATPKAIDAKPKAKAAKAKPKPKPKPAKAKQAANRQSNTKSARTRASSAARRTSPNREASGGAASGFDLTKLIDHPLVADLLAVGAMAAVAAIADHHVKTRTGEAESGSSKAVKAAGKAAAAAIGRRLMTEVDAVKKASGPKQGTRGSA